jgi:hypothetical protein
VAPGRRGHTRQREGAPGGDFSAGRDHESPSPARAVGVGLVNAAYRSGDESRGTDFVEFTLDNSGEIADTPRFIPATEEQVAEARSALAA